MQAEVSPASPDVVPAHYVEAALARAERVRRKPITSRDLAKLIGVNEGTVSRWRSGKTEVSRARWLVILAVLGIPLTWEPQKQAEIKRASRKGIRTTRSTQ